jgi:hypothetical protein
MGVHGASKLEAFCEAEIGRAALTLAAAIALCGAHRLRHFGTVRHCRCRLCLVVRAAGNGSGKDGPGRSVRRCRRRDGDRDRDEQPEHELPKSHGAT